MAKIVHADIGDRLQPQATFTVSGTPTDPTQIVVRQQDADGIETTVTTAANPASLNAGSSPLAKVSTGVYKLNPGTAANKAGYWFFRFEGTGTAESAEDFQYTVDPSEFTTDGGISSRALVSLAEAKDWLKMQQINTGDDLSLVRVINDVSGRFHDESGREFKAVGTNPQTRAFWAEPDTIMWGSVSVGDMTSLSTATTTPVRIVADDWATQFQALTSASVLLEPETRSAWEPVRRIRLNARTTTMPRAGYRVQVDGNYGFPSVPGTVRQAVLDAVASIYDRDVTHWRQDLGPATGGEGTNVIVMPGRPQLLSLPPSAAAVARGFSDSTVA